MFHHETTYGSNSVDSKFFDVTLTEAGLPSPIIIELAMNQSNGKKQQTFMGIYKLTIYKLRDSELLRSCMQG
jgi:hypothetical protein